ncbi:Wzz/FepE/Etk N-terminal domain-containing protein [Glaciimonas sp. GG7]
MPNNLPNNQPRITSQETENTGAIDLIQLWSTIKQQWVIVSTCIVLGCAAAVALWLTLPPKWQATAILQIGQMPLSMSSKEAPQTVLVEPPAQAVERLNHREQEDKALAALGLPIDNEVDKGTALFRKSLKGTVVRNTNFIEISVAAYSIEDGKKYLNAAIQSLIEVHNQRMAPVLDNVNAQVKENTAQMAEAQSQLANLQKIVPAMPKSDSQFAPRVIAADLLAKQNEQIQHLTKERNALSDILLPSNTYPTSVIDAVFVPERPYFPKLSLILPIGLFLGTAIGIALALMRKRRQNNDLKTS